MDTQTLARMRKAHEVLAEFHFERKDLHRGYSDQYLRIDVTQNKFQILPVSDQMKRLFTGGKGFDLWMMFQEIGKETKWDSPENPICFSSGPLGGTTSFPGSGKTLVTSVSPMTHAIIDCNVGGYFGPYLKFAGFDAMTILGKSKEEIIIVIDAVQNKITIERAPMEKLDAHVVCEELTLMYADNELDRKNIAVVAAGSAADHARMGVLNFSFWDWRRGVARIKQAGRGGIGTVFRNKRLKALVLKSLPVTPAWRISESKVAMHFKQTKPACLREIEEIRTIINKWNCNPEFVIEMMQDIQDQHRFISKSAIDEISALTRASRGQLYHIATFYKSFSLEPRGEKVIQICVGTACHVKGAGLIVDAFERELQIQRGETTSDGKFTLEPVGCLGCCSLAPAVKINETIYGDVQLKDVARIVEEERR